MALTELPQPLLVVQTLGSVLFHASTMPPPCAASSTRGLPSCVLMAPRPLQEHGVGVRVSSELILSLVLYAEYDLFHFVGPFILPATQVYVARRLFNNSKRVPPSAAFVTTCGGWDVAPRIRLRKAPWRQALHASGVAGGGGGSMLGVVVWAARWHSGTVRL